MRVISGIARDAISHCGDSIEGKLLTAVDELKGPEFGNATDETERMPSLRSQTMLMKMLLTWTN
jgi:hypothetical protein